jgi:hypothetical protein
MNKLILRFGLLILGILFCVIPYYFSISEGITVILVLFGIPFILIGLLIATRSSMLGFGKNLQTINGIGTTLYGKSNFEQNNQSYVTTKWLVFLWLPIIPLASYKVIKGEIKSKFMGTETPYQMIDMPMNKTQIIKTYSITYGLIILLIIVYLS